MNKFGLWLMATLVSLAANVFAAPDPNFYIYLCFGQSNMDGSAVIEDQDRTAVDRFQVMAAMDMPGLNRKIGNWYPAVPPLSRESARVSPADYFGRTMVASLPDNIRVGVVIVTVPGCKIELFDKDNYKPQTEGVEPWMAAYIEQYAGNPYQRLIEVAKLAQKDGVIKGILLHQGESNTNDQQWPVKVKGIYDNLMKDLDLNHEEVPLLAGETVNADHGGVCASMNTIIASLPQHMDNCYVVSSAGLSCLPDKLHFDAAGYREFGKRYAQKMLALPGYQIKMSDKQVSAKTESTGKRIIGFGSDLDPVEQVKQSQELAKSLAKPDSPQWQAKGDQKRSYLLPDSGTQVAYRVCVPASWDGKSKLPLVMFLHGAGNTESSYLDANNKQMVKLADEHGYLLVAPLGYGGAYGTSLRLPGQFGRAEDSATVLARRTPERDKAQEISEKDVINVLELVLNEYPIERSQMFLTGHSMGSGGTWYIGAKYPEYWAALAPMSGPFVQETTYPWERIRKMAIFMSEGTKAPASLEGSRQMNKWMKENGFQIYYEEVEADHPGMVPLVLPKVFEFFDHCKTNGVINKIYNASVAFEYRLFLI